MNKKIDKKGFTLIEILATTFILSIVIGLGVYFANQYIDNSEKKVVSISENNILAAAELHLKEYIDEIIWDENQIAYVKVEQLINKGYLKEPQEYKEKCVYIKKTDYNYEKKIVDCSNSEKTVIEIPKAKEYCKDIQYNKTKQEVTKIVAAGKGFKFENNKYTDAGSHKVTVKLEDTDNYIWEDSTKEDKTITCTIKKAKPQLIMSSLGSEWSIGTKEVTLTSNVDGELKAKSSNTNYVNAKITNGSMVTSNIAKKIKINTTATRENDTTITFTLIPTDKNYENGTFIYVIGNIEKQPIAIPTCKENLEYVGDSMKLIEESDKYTLENNIQSAIGTYKVKVHLNYGYYWNDGDTIEENNEEIKEIECSIINRSNIITLDDQGATQSSNPTTLTAIYNEQIPNLISIPKKEYTVTYKYTIPASVADKNASSSQQQDIIYKRTFKGFFSEPNGKGTKYINESGNGTTWDQTEDKTLYAHWETTVLTAPSVKTPSGYNAIYWTTTNNAAGTKVTIANYKPTENTTLYGHILDTTAPTCTINVTASDGTEDKKAVRLMTNWYAENVVVKYTCNDNGSGCQAHTKPEFAATGQTISTEGTTTIAESTIKDKSGNSSTCSKTVINLDKTAPTITYKRVSPVSSDGDNWQNFKHVIKATHKDSLSGISKVTRSSCASGSTNHQYCSWKDGYGATNRLKKYLAGQTLKDDNKSSETYCKITSGKFINQGNEKVERYKLSWNKFQITMYVQDMAGNIYVYYIRRKSDGTYVQSNKTSEFTYSAKCLPLP